VGKQWGDRLCHSIEDNSLLVAASLKESGGRSIPIGRRGFSMTSQTAASSVERPFRNTDREKSRPSPLITPDSGTYFVIRAIEAANQILYIHSSFTLDGWRCKPLDRSHHAQMQIAPIRTSHAAMNFENAYRGSLNSRGRTNAGMMQHFP
jgi:hypothetical protein